VGDREILETYLNSASKNTQETVIFPHGTKFLLTSVISEITRRSHDRYPEYCPLSGERNPVRKNRQPILVLFTFVDPT